MGHLFRALNLAEALGNEGQSSTFYINNHIPTIKILADRSLSHRILVSEDWTANGIASLIARDNINLWINDRHNTAFRQAQSVKATGIPLVTFDDRGPGAALADLHVAALSFDENEALEGKKVLRGVNYLILNPQIKKYKRTRESFGRLIVTLGGSDTHGVTIRVVKILKTMKLAATIVIGPAFKHLKKLEKELKGPFILKQSVPSLIEEFFHHDLAITGGGITPFEANASGLPCVVIANEEFEVPVGKALQGLGGSVYAGFYKDIRSPLFQKNIPINEMSRAGIKNINLLGAKHVVKNLLETAR